MYATCLGNLKKKLTHGPFHLGAPIADRNSEKVPA